MLDSNSFDLWADGCGKIENLPQISAIYYALLQCGYDFFYQERSEAHIAAIEKFAGKEAVPPFFSSVKQATCAVYPYWPRAAILETATFYLDDTLNRFRDFEAFRSRILSAGNITPEEKVESLWDWIVDFPAALSSVMTSNGFECYLDWENGWIAAQNTNCAKELRSLEEMLHYCLQAGKVRIILSPLKCVFASDYYADKNGLTFILGSLRLDSIVHESLHPVVHPMLAHMDCPIKMEKYPGIDESYYQGGTDAGYLNAFEEYAVRKLTEDFLRHCFPTDIDGYLRELAKSRL
ncbi:MAG: hypothetical protein E7425_10705 [Ruminococcaceae bacterium]|nr:hypothetical protein [Oscillospiraceae bacterium]